MVVKDLSPQVMNKPSTLNVIALSLQISVFMQPVRAYGLMRDYGLISYGLTRYLDALVVPLSQDLAESVLLLRLSGTSHPCLERFTMSNKNISQ